MDILAAALVRFGAACVSGVTLLLRMVLALTPPPRVVAGTLCCAVAATAVAAGAHAEDSKRSYRFPRGDAATILAQFATESGRPILFMMDAVRGEQTNALTGSYTPREALDRLLAGTALVAVHDPKSGGFIINRRAAPSKPEQAEAEKARGPPEGNSASPPATPKTAQPNHKESPPVKKSPFSALRAWLGLALAPASIATAADGTALPTGTIVGVVKNAATDEALTSASVSIAGSQYRTVTGRDGRYSLTLPPGRYALNASFTGLDSVKSAVEVPSGQTVEVNFALTAEIYRMDQFVVRTVREDEAVALQQQRFAANLKTVVATGAYGTPADNPGEILQRMSGVSVGFEQGEVNNLSIRGMGQGFSKLTVDGQSAATSFGNFLAQGPTGQAVTGREFIVTELATNNLSQIELIKAPTPDQDADAIAGTVNLVTRRYYDRTGRTIQLNASLSGLWRDFDTSPFKSTLGRYGRTSFSYNDSFSAFGGKNNLGAAFDVSWSRIFRAEENTGPQQAGNLTAAYVNPTAENPLPRLFSTTEVGGPIEKLNGSLNVDYKLGTSGYVFARVGFTNQDRSIPRVAAATAGTPTTVTGFAPGSSLARATVLPLPGAQLQTLARNSLRRSELFTSSLGGEYKFFDQTAVLNLVGSYSRSASKNPYFVNASAAVSGIGFTLDQGGDAFRPNLTQTAGPSWSDPGNYRISTISNIVTKGTPTENKALQGDLRKHLSTSFPAFLKGGFKINDRTSEDQRITDSWTFVGADGVANTADDSLASLPTSVFRMGRNGYGPFVFLPLVNSKEQIAPGSSWKRTAAQAYSDLTAAFARPTEIEESAAAGYLLGDIRIGKLRAVAGVRAERTDVKTATWIRNATASWGGNSVGGASVDPAVVAANVARADRSFVGRQRMTSSYTEIFPGAHLIWEGRGNLLLRASYNRSLARPPISQMLPTTSVDDETMRLTIGNTKLKPYLADNFELSLEKYLEPVGLIGVGVFRKNITNYFRSFTDVVGTDGIDGSGLYAGYERITTRNIGSAKLQGFELNVQQQFRKLPGLLAGLGAFANFTYLQAEGDFGALAITRRLPDMTPRSANGGISYVGHGWQIRPMLNWQGRTYRGTSGNLDFDSASRTMIDLKVQYSWSRRYTFDLSVFNLTNEPTNTLISSDGRLPFVQIKPGIAYSFGVAGRF